MPSQGFACVKLACVPGSATTDRYPWKDKFAYTKKLCNLPVQSSAEAGGNRWSQWPRGEPIVQQPTADDGLKFGTYSDGDFPHVKPLLETATHSACAPGKFYPYVGIRDVVVMNTVCTSRDTNFFLALRDCIVLLLDLVNLFLGLFTLGVNETLNNWASEGWEYSSMGIDL